MNIDKLLKPPIGFTRQQRKNWHDTRRHCGLQNLGCRIELDDTFFKAACMRVEKALDKLTVDMRNVTFTNWKIISGK